MIESTWQVSYSKYTVRHYVWNSTWTHWVEYSVSSCRIPPIVSLKSSIYYKVSTLSSSRQVKSSFRSYFPSRNDPIIRPKSERVTALQCHNSPLDFFYFDWFPQNVKSILINNDSGIERRFKIIKGNNVGGQRMNVANWSVLDKTK